MESLVKVNKFLKTGNGKKIIHIFLSIFAGSIIYILFREKNLLMFKWFKFLKCNVSANVLALTNANIKITNNFFILIPPTFYILKPKLTPNFIILYTFSFLLILAILNHNF